MGQNPRGGKLTFQLPVVGDKPDRFCFFCGCTVKADWKKCTNPECRADAKSLFPTPPGWILCRKCKLGYLQACDHFCTVCRNRTDLGSQWVQERSQLDKQIKRMKFELNSRYGHSPVLPSVSPVPPPAPAALAPQPAPPGPTPAPPVPVAVDPVSQPVAPAARTIASAARPGAARVRRVASASHSPAATAPPAIPPAPPAAPAAIVAPQRGFDLDWDEEMRLADI